MTAIHEGTRPAQAPAAWLTGLAVSVALLLLPTIAASPLLGPGLPDTGDAQLHIYRAVQLEASLLEGDLYPRWAPDFAQGLGYPIFNYYAPLTYYVLVGIHWLGFAFVDALKVLCWLVFFASGLGMYLWARQLLGVPGGLLAATAYTYAPYRFVDVYVRGDVAELLALAFPPFILWALYRLVRQPGLPWVAPAVLLYAALILTHNLTALTFTPLLLAYLLVLVAVLRAWRSLPFVAAAVALALGLTAFYWVPSLLEKDLVQIDRVLTPPTFDYRAHFVAVQDLLAVQMPIDRRLGDVGIPKALGASLVVLAVGGLLGFFIRRPARPTLWQGVFLALATLALAVLMTPASRVLWDAVPLAAYVQFPWRLLGLTALGLALLVGAAARLLLPGDGPGAPGRLVFLPAAGLALLTLAVVMPTFVLLYPTERSRVSANPTIRDTLRFEHADGALGTTGGEYLPMWVEYLPEPSPMLPAYEGSAPMERLNRPSLPANVEAELLHRSGRHEAYRFRADRPTTILMNVLYFPFWHAYVDGTEVPVSAFEPYGLVTFTVPAGERLVELRREMTTLAHGATWVSYGALAVTVAAALAGGALRRRRSHPVAERSPTGAVAGYCALAVGATVLGLTMLKLGYIDAQTTWFRTTTAPGTAAGSQYALSVDFGGQVICLGYDLDSRRVKAGGTVRLRLYWEAIKEMDTDYSVLVHVVSRPGTPPVAQKDSLHPANIPTSRWQPGKYIPDLHEIVIPTDLAAGEYEVIFGLYDPRPGGKRLAADGREGEQAYHSLGKLVVLP